MKNKFYVSAVYGDRGLNRFEIREEDSERVVHSYSRKEIEKNLLWKYVNQQKDGKRDTDRKVDKKLHPTKKGVVPKSPQRDSDDSSTKKSK